MIQSPDSAGTPLAVNLDVAALFATNGEIPARAAKVLAFDGEPQLLAAQVSVSPSAETGTLAFTAIGPRGKQAADRANAFADATIEYFQQQKQSAAEARIDQLKGLVRSTARRLEILQVEASGDDPVKDAELAAVQAQYTSLFSELTQLNQTLSGPSR